MYNYWALYYLYSINACDCNCPVRSSDFSNQYSLNILLVTYHYSLEYLVTKCVLVLSDFSVVPHQMSTECLQNAVTAFCKQSEDILKISFHSKWRKDSYICVQPYVFIYRANMVSYKLKYHLWWPFRVNSKKWYSSFTHMTATIW